MVPTGPIQTCSKLIGEAIPRSNWALLHTGNTVIPRCLLLQHSVPVESSSLFGSRNLVVDRHLNHITPIRLNLRTRKLAVDEDHILKISVWCDLSTGDSEVIVSDDTSVWCFCVGITPGGGEETPWKPGGERVVCKE